MTPTLLPSQRAEWVSQTTFTELLFASKGGPKRRLPPQQSNQNHTL